MVPDSSALIFCTFIDEKLVGILLARDIFLSVRDLHEHWD